MKTISFAKANRDFEAVLDTVNNNAEMMFVNRQNGNDAVIMSLAHYNSWWCSKKYAGDKSQYEIYAKFSDSIGLSRLQKLFKF